MNTYDHYSSLDELPGGGVVVGVDGSSSSLRAVRWSVDQAVSEHRPLILVHAMGAVTPTWVDQAALDPAAARQAMLASASDVLPTPGRRPSAAPAAGSRSPR